jgi:hypothetical protein
MSLTPPAPIQVSSLDPQMSGRIMENTAGSIYVLAVQSARSRALRVAALAFGEVYKRLE